MLPSPARRLSLLSVPPAVPPLVALLMAASLSGAFAHDLWLQPEQGSSAPGTLRIRAVVGARFPKGEESKKAADYRDARSQRVGKMAPLADFGKEPTLLGSVKEKEAFFAAVIGPTREIDLKPNEVREYLTEELGTDAATIDSMLKDGGPTLHETYSRTLKAFVVPKGASSVPNFFPPPKQRETPSAPSEVAPADTGTISGPLADVPFGLPLEIVLTRWDPGHDPKQCDRRHAGPCTSLAFQLLKDGKPLPGAFLRIVSADGKTQKVRTDQEGMTETRDVVRRGPVLIAFIELAASEKGRYETRWTNLAIHDFR